MTKLSIITINYNNCNGLRRTLQSVSAQTTKDFQYIVIDGGSTDGSIDVVNEYASIIDYWVSEPDKGIYNAMNKGVRAACGVYCNFLNSGDTLNNNKVVDKFNACTLSADIITGIEQRVTSDNSYKCIKPPEHIVSDIFITSSIGHGCSFIRRNLLVKRPYDENFSIVSDWKFFLEELLINNATYSPWLTVVNNFDMSGVSNTQLKKMMYERQIVLSKVIPPKILGDYTSLIQGRSELERIIHNERKGGLIERVLTIVAKSILFISHLIKS